MTRGLDVVALGARTAVGLGFAASAAAVRAGISGAREYPFVDEEGEPMHVAADRRLHASVVGPERLLALARSAVDEALCTLQLASSHDGPIAVLLALPEVRPGLSELEIQAVEAGVARHVRESHPTASVMAAGFGHAAAALAVERAVNSSGAADNTLTLIVGVDGFVRPETLMWLEAQRVFGPRARTGVIPGEGAGCVVLAPTGLRKSLRLACLAKVAGVGTAREALLADSETGSFGEGMTRALRDATAGSDLPSEAGDDVYSDINGERYRSEEWGFVCMRFPSAFRTLRYHAPADCWGDVGAATGALAIALAARGWARNYARGPRALITAGSRNGDRGAIFLMEPST